MEYTQNAISANYAARIHSFGHQMLDGCRRTKRIFNTDIRRHQMKKKISLTHRFTGFGKHTDGIVIDFGGAYAKRIIIQST